MGRQAHLTRLALGRSAFREPEEGNPSHQTTGLNSTEDGRPVQQYDIRGRPVNPATEAFNARMREAQNDFQTLFGIVERKDEIDRLEELRRGYVKEIRHAVLTEEQDRGEVLELLFVPLAYIVRLWPECFLQRIQIGFYDSKEPFATNVLNDWNALWTGSLASTVASIFPGMAETLVHFLIRLPLGIAVEQVSGRLQLLVGKGRLRRKMARRMCRAISISADILCIILDVALLPVQFYAMAQRLRLAPPLPLLPQVDSILPWRPASFHRIGWKSFASVWAFRFFTSSAALMLISNAMRLESDDDFPIFSAFTDFRLPQVNDNPARTKQPLFIHDPFGWFIHQTWCCRNAVLRWSGWKLVKIEPMHHAGMELEQNTTIDSEHILSFKDLPLYRSTRLAHLPAMTLARMTDTFFTRLLTLPFDSLMLRTIAATYSSSSYRKSNQAVQVAPRLYPPFRSGLFHGNNWVEASHYASKVGLALAFNVCIDALLFGGVYLAVRSSGVNFFWGNKRIYEEEEDSTTDEAETETEIEEAWRARDAI